MAFQRNRRGVPSSKGEEKAFRRNKKSDPSSKGRQTVLVQLGTWNASRLFWNASGFPIRKRLCYADLKAAVVVR